MTGGNRLLMDFLKTWIADPGATPPDPELVKTHVDEIATSDGATLAVLAFLLYHFQYTSFLEPDQVSRLNKYRHFLVANTAVMMRDLDAFLRETDEAGIPVLLLKGVALSKGGVYPQEGLRMLSDIDVLVHGGDIPRVEKLLADMGWTLDEHESELHEDHHIPIRYGPGGTPLEVHFAISRLPMEDMVERFWERSTPAGGFKHARIPSIEDTLMNLAINAVLHHPEKLVPLHVRFVVDFAFIWKFRGPELDWTYIDDTTRRVGLAGPFMSVLAVVRRLIDPPGMGDIVPGMDGGADVDQGYVDMMVSDILGEGKSKDLSWLVILASEERNPLKRLYKIIQAVFPSRKFMAEAYPQWTGFPNILRAYAARMVKVTRNFDYANIKRAYRVGRVCRSVSKPED